MVAQLLSLQAGEEVEPFRFCLANGAPGYFQAHSSPGEDPGIVLLQLFTAPAPIDEFTLESAAWPALLLDDSKKITRVNPAALKIFGADAVKEGSALTGIWLRDN